MKTYVKFICLIAALAIAAVSVVSCSAGSNESETSAETTANVTESNTEAESDAPVAVPVNESASEADFTITVMADNSVVSLADIANGDVTSLIYDFKAEYVSDETKAIAYFPAICAVTIMDENDNAPFGVAALRWLFDYAYMESGDTLEKEYNLDSSRLEKFTAPGNYFLSFEFEYTTEEMYFAEDYQNTPTDVYPTDKQISDGCSTYRITVKAPLTVVE